MATLHATVKTMMTGDATLMALLTGGVFDGDSLDFTGEGASEAPREADEVVLKPHAIIHWDGRSPRGNARKVKGKLEPFEVYVYQDTGFDVIESAILRLCTLFEDKYLSVTDRALAHVTEDSFTSGEIADEAMGNAACKFVRFFIVTAPI